MNILLIYPKYLTSSSAISKTFSRTLPPIGLLNLAGFLQSNGHIVEILDVEVESLSLDNIISRIKNFNPHIIGISTTTASFKEAKKTAGSIKKFFPHIPVVLGGPHITIYPEITMEFEEFDIGIIGEGELTFLELIERIEQKKSWEDIPGIIYRKNTAIIKNRMREYIHDLDSLPFSAWNLVNLSRYNDIMSKKNKFAPLVTSRGCPYDCIYCDRNGRLGKRYRYMGAERIYSEIEFLYKDYNIEEICFYDDSFTVYKKRIFDLCKLIQKKNLNIIWECRTRVDTVDRELLSEMKKAGCYRIRFGIESANPELLKFLKKNITLEEAENAILWSKELGIETMAYFMLGVPYETDRTINNTINFALKTDPDYAIFSPTNLAYNAKTELYYWAVQQGYIASDYLERWIKGEKLDPFPLLETETMPKEKLLNYSRKAYRKFYIRGKVFVREFKKINSLSIFFKYLKIFIAIIIKKFEG